jgi:16S rRNA (guanine1516-N2)-methyltransferase
MLKIANKAHYYKAYARELVENLKSIQTDNEYRIQIDDCTIAICSELNNQNACFTHSFLDPRLIKRASQKNQGLLKACSNKKNTIRNITDLTAGWGKDSYLLAHQGRHVQMLEHNPLIYHCLNYLLKSARDESNQPIFQQISLQLLDSYSYLKQDSIDEVDCFYLDPMFPAHKSSARPGKDLQLLQAITQNQSIEQTFQLALKKCVQRVVVKRPLHAPFLDDLKPDISYREKTIRFDVYLG